MTARNETVRKEMWNETEGILESYSWGIANNAGDELSWNNRGNITQIKKNGTVYDYEYDGKNQLTVEKNTTKSITMNTWNYDSKGNRSESNGKSVICYENSDLIKDDGTWKYSYDMNGNLVWKGKSGTSKTVATDNLYEGWSYNATSGEVWYYGYDNFNRLVLVKKSTAGTDGLNKVAEYTYDYRDLVVCRNADEYFEYTPEGTLIYDGRPYPNSDRDYVYANGSVWCELTGAVNVFYHHTDHLGTTEYMTDAAGTLVWQCEYESFGKVIKKSGSKASSFKPMYTGKQLDESTGLYYFNARWYDPGQGRFITQDPARDGSNWYAYCSNNPLIFLDSDGLFAVTAFLVKTAIGAATGAVIGFATNVVVQVGSNVIEQATTGKEINIIDAVMNIDMKSAGAATLSGAVSGAITGGAKAVTDIATAVYTSKVASAVLNTTANMVGTTTGTVVDNIAHNNNMTDGLGLNLAISAAAGVISGTTSKTGINVLDQQKNIDSVYFAETIDQAGIITTITNVATNEIGKDVGVSIGQELAGSVSNSIKGK